MDHRRRTASSCTPGSRFDDAAGDRGLPGRARRQPPVLLALPAGRAGQHATATTSSTTAASNDELGGADGPRPAARGAGGPRARARCSTSSRTTWRRDGRANRWWWDVLEHGPSSRYAGLLRHRLGTRAHPSGACRCRARLVASWATTTAACSRPASSGSRGQSGRSSSATRPRAAPVAAGTLEALRRCRPTPTFEAPRRGDPDAPRRPARAAALPAGVLAHRGRRSSTTAASSTSRRSSACARGPRSCSPTPTGSCSTGRRGRVDGLRRRPRRRAARPRGLPATGCADASGRRLRSWSRRSSSRTSSCPHRGRWPARSGYDFLTRVNDLFVDADARGRADRRATPRFTGEPDAFERGGRPSAEAPDHARRAGRRGRAARPTARRGLRAPPPPPRPHAPRARATRCASWSPPSRVYRTYVAAGRAASAPPTGHHVDEAVGAAAAAPARHRRRAARLPRRAPAARACRRARRPSSPSASSSSPRR